MKDTSTHLGAEIAGWAYPASMKDIFMLLGVLRSDAAFRSAAPWAPNLVDAKNTPTEDEVAAAQAELEAGIVFS